MMNDLLRPDLNPELGRESQMIDQLTVIRGCVQLVLMRYPGDLFLKESLDKVLDAAERLTELVLQEA